MIEIVRTERDGGVLVIVIENPPINAGSIEVRRGILEAINTLANDANLRAGVIIGGGNTFIAGSDLREFGRPLEDPQLPTVIAAIEACAKPIVAALHGAALGGGFELALGCDARVASPKTVVGLPEVSLGMIPGAGGTQRLPRIVGAAMAIRLICSSERLSAATAKDMGIVDQISEGDLREAAVRFATHLTDKRRLRDVYVPLDEMSLIDSATADAIKCSHGRPQVISAIEMVLASLKSPIDEALLRERDLFQKFRMSPDAAALRHLFFAEREASKPPKVLHTPLRTLNTVAIIGVGNMGAGIAISVLDAGLRVILLEQDTDTLERGRDRVLKHFKNRVTAGKLKVGEIAAYQERLTPTTDWAQLGHADLIIESAFEDLVLKQDIFRKIDTYARIGAILATNTSYLDIDAIANATQRPQDVVGLHFFNPAHTVKLLEVVGGKKTSPDVQASGMEFAKKLGKLPVLSGNFYGFIGSRINNAYRKQCELMLEDGALPEDIDSAMQAFGFEMGPFAFADLSGLDLTWKMRGEQPSIQRGITCCSLSATEIQRRSLLAIVNETALLMGEGVARQACDVDVVMVQGYGFPRWEGGPVHWARRQNRIALENDLKILARDAGHGFVTGDLTHLLTL